MLYTAAMLLCLVDAPMTYETCEIMNAEFKYRSEEHCWLAINGKLKQMEEFPVFGAAGTYEVRGAQCIEWLPMEENTPKQAL